MTARVAVLAASLALICALAVLTLRVAVREGLDVLVALSLLVLCLLASACSGRWRRRDGTSRRWASRSSPRVAAGVTGVAGR
jgi:hypothetical protein